MGNNIRVEDLAPQEAHAVIEAAIQWWENLRPEGWTEEQHLVEPEVNTIDDLEGDMALKVAAVVRARRYGVQL